MTDAAHIPVMLDEVLEYLSPAEGETYLDGTFGLGGYSRAILEAAGCTLYATDRDPTAILIARELEKEFKGRFHILPGCFGDMGSLLADAGVTRLDGIVLDLGVSSPQLDRPERGFSFRFDGPLDMRMGETGMTAAEFVNTAEEAEIADVIYNLGEERLSRRVAKAIVAARSDAAIETTFQLAGIVRSVVPKSKDGIDPATRTFQAIRIHINDEMGEIDRALIAAERLLAPGGRIVVVSFHSLEDRRVKAFLKMRSGRAGGGSRHRPMSQEASREPSFKLCANNAVKPTEAETKTNPRARSARLRAAIRTGAPAWGREEAA